ncbi:MAG: NADH-quinone oxidoreductase subunit C [Dehalococcoidia bacterium]|nr:NADH-quinone oxidoreductase subunit C [Dehalococcoidia bacterium]
MERLTPQAIIDSFREKLGDGFISGSVYEREVAVKKNKFRSLWVEVNKSAFRNAVEHICNLQKFPHLAIISSSDLGAEVELIYHFTIYYGYHLEELSLGLRVKLPKSDLRIPTITDLIPGAIFTERETQEMMGVEVMGIPDGRRLFIAEDVPAGVYPWRKDETGPERLLRVLPGRKPKTEDKKG